jgi:ABC-type dipeptide/oligopeptide/nickel transport system permease subunit
LTPSASPASPGRLFGLALLSSAGLILEISLTRLFSTLFYPPYVFAILSLAVLGIGLGTQPLDPSWGLMLSDGRAYFRQLVWMALFPGLAITLTVMGFNFLGDGLRDAMDPLLKNV